MSVKMSAIVWGGVPPSSDVARRPRTDRSFPKSRERDRLMLSPCSPFPALDQFLANSLAGDGSEGLFQRLSSCFGPERCGDFAGLQAREGRPDIPNARQRRLG